MKKIGIGLFALMIASSLTFADVYNDATGDLDPSFGTLGNLDIDTVTMTSDALNLYVTISVALNPIDGDGTPAQNWGNYMIGFDTTAGGDTSLGDNTAPANGNGWDRPIQMTDNGGMDYWVGSWVNTGGGVQVWDYDGANWNSGGTPSAVVGTDLALTIPLADLGLSSSQSFTFDVYTSGSGGTDGAVDALSSATPTITAWDGAYDTGVNGLTYTVVPEPASIALIFGAGLLAIFRRRK